MPKARLILLLQLQEKAIIRGDEREVLRLNETMQREAGVKK